LRLDIYPSRYSGGLPGGLDKFFAEDHFLAVLDTSGKLSVYWSDQDQNKAVEQKYLQPWKEVYLFVLPDVIFAIGDLKFRFIPYLPSRL